MNPTYDNYDAFDALVYGEQNPSNIQYLQQRIGHSVDRLTEYGKNFLSDVGTIFNKFNGSEALKFIRATTKAAKTLFQPNIINYLTDLEAIQQSNFVMQRWIMAQPDVRALYQKQLCHGFSDSYVDNDKKGIGETHYDYRRVMDGVVTCTDESFGFKFFPDELYEGDKELSHEDKEDILSTWSIVKAFIDQGIDDPTSPYGGKL